MTTEKKKGNIIAIIAMFFLFAMISFVTNLAAPIGTIWKGHYDWSGMLGNMMNFLAYLFMGIPAGKLLVKIGYKKTALSAMVIGIIGLFLQFLSSQFGADTVVFNVGLDAVTLNFLIYLLGAFICGFCVCMLNTVVNPMLNLLGGGGNRGNQLVQMGGTLNSLAGTCTPFAVGALIGMVTNRTTIADVNPLLFVAIGVFVLAFIVISCVSIPEPHMAKKGAKAVKYSHSAWSFRHTVLGVIGIFFYVGIEIAIPGTLIFYITELTGNAALAGAVAAIYWLLMLCGRFVSSIISGYVSSRAQLICVSATAIVLVALAIVLPKDNGVKVPGFIFDPEAKTTEMLQKAEVPQETISEIVALPSHDAASLAAYSEVLTKADVNPSDITNAMNVPEIPFSAFLLVLCGLCTSVMWGGIFNLAVEGLGKYTAQASGIFMMMVVGGGVMPLIQDWIANSFSDKLVGYIQSYWLVVAMLAYLLYYGLIGSKNVNTDIPVNEEEAPTPLDL
ncbi:MAG: sugar MFS transporter [Bacteroides sp.]|nr:sugar MFS transporter [Bacteroides sp.]MBD5349927.1 sugar MFS transporter [Bacteroides sp.]